MKILLQSRSGGRPSISQCGYSLCAVLAFLCLPGGSNPLLAASPTAIECGSVPSAILHRSVGYCIDLPADYASAAPKRYPALYFLHGLFGNDHRWIDRGGKEIFDQLAA